MDKLKDRYGLGIILCLLSLILLIWSAWPIKLVTRELVFNPGELQVSDPAHEVSAQDPPAGNSSHPLAFPDTRTVILEWMPIIRKGDPSKIILSFAGTNAINDGVTKNNLPPFENLYHVYSVNAEDRVELPGFDEDPSGISGKVLPEDHDLEFSWKIIPNEEGLYKGTAWLYLQFFPILEGDYIDQAVSAQSFDIKVVSIFGLNSNYLRVIGVFGLIIGIYIQKIRINLIILRVYTSITRKTTNKYKNIYMN